MNASLVINSLKLITDGLKFILQHEWGPVSSKILNFFFFTFILIYLLYFFITIFFKYVNASHVISMTSICTSCVFFFSFYIMPTL